MVYFGNITVSNVNSNNFVFITIINNETTTKINGPQLDMGVRNLVFPLDKPSEAPLSQKPVPALPLYCL